MTQGNTILQARALGVRLPENQSTGTGPTMKLMNVEPGHWALAQYGNERGQAELTVVFICGGKVYVPSHPNHQAWTNTFKPLHDDIGKQIIATIEAREEVKGDPDYKTIPKQDAVDVLGATQPTQASGGMVDVFSGKP